MADDAFSTAYIEEDPDINPVSSELIFGLIAPVGTDVDCVREALSAALVTAGFQQINYRLSDIFVELRMNIDASTEYNRIRTSMDAGDLLRRQTRSPEIMARQAVYSIAQDRKLNAKGDPYERCAHILRSLKRPEEVQYLRKLYGPRFFLLSITSSQEERVALLQRSGMPDAQATALVQRDAGDGSEHGQATRDAFEMADLFVGGNSTEISRSINRFIELILGSPRYTPQRDEHFMSLAYSTSLRSGDLSRQVGAILTTSDGVLLAEGCNDAPRYDGGSHWPGDYDRRDIVLGCDANEQAKSSIIAGIVNAIVAAKGLGDFDRNLVEKAVERSQVVDITEYGRAVHAEMAVLAACARQGTSTRGSTLYSTTFPCHNCAKHIIAAGVREVIFIEPYPKSKALSLHEDALSMSSCKDKVHMRPFVGIGPRRYQQLFVLQGPYGERVRRKADGRLTEWNSRTASPAFHDRLVTYLKLEVQAVEEFEKLLTASRQPHDSPPAKVDGVLSGSPLDTKKARRTRKAKPGRNT